MATSAACREAAWSSNLMRDAGCQGLAPNIFIDNTSAIKLCKNPEFCKRTKHIDVQHHLIRQKCENKEITVERI